MQLRIVSIYSALQGTMTEVLSFAKFANVDTPKSERKLIRHYHITVEWQHRCHKTFTARKSV